MGLDQIQQGERTICCPNNNCGFSVSVLKREDLVKHIHKQNVRETHYELYVKYQGMEFICCGETYKASGGAWVKHLQTYCTSACLEPTSSLADIDDQQ